MAEWIQSLSGGQQLFIAVFLAIAATLALSIASASNRRRFDDEAEYDPALDDEHDYAYDDNPSPAVAPPAIVPRRTPAATAQPVRPPQPKPLWPTVKVQRLAIAKNILIVGGPGSGKTVLQNMLVRLRMQGGSEIQVVDPHNYPGKWSVPVIGSGGNYDEIGVALTAAESLLKQRNEQLSSGEVREGKFPRVTLVGDEWRNITRRVPDAGRVLGHLLTEGRKFGVCVIAGSHNDTNAAIGSAGDKQSFMNSFDWIVYMGGFAAEQLSRAGIGYPTFVSPNDQTESPLLVVARHTGERKNYLLSLRGFAQHMGGSNAPDNEGLVPSLAALLVPAAGDEDDEDEGSLLLTLPQRAASATSDDPPVGDMTYWDGMAMLVLSGNIQRIDLLKSLGYQPGGGSKRYQAARAALEEAIQRIEASRAA